MKSDLHELTEEEAALVQLYRLADERGRNIIMGIAEIQYRLTIKSRIDEWAGGFSSLYGPPAKSIFPKMEK